MASITVSCDVTLQLQGDVPEWAKPDAQRIMDEICEDEEDRVRRRFERALADRFGEGVLGTSSTLEKT